MIEPSSDGPPERAAALLLNGRRTRLSEVRRWVRRQLADESPRCVQDVVLVAHELVANAYHHTTTPRLLELSTDGAGGVIRIEVEDGDPQLMSTAAPPCEATHDGWGLQFVSALSVDWGVLHSTTGKIVWADVPRRLDLLTTM